MSISVPYSTAHHDGWLFSETLTVSGGFVHIITRIAEDEDALETEITEHRFPMCNLATSATALL